MNMPAALTIVSVKQLFVQINLAPTSASSNKENTLFFFFYKNVVFPIQAEYSYFSADFRLKIFLYYS